MTVPLRVASILGLLAAVGAAQDQVASRIRFTDVAGPTGLTSFLNIAGTPSKDFLIDASGNGVAFFDFDNDRDLDVLLVNGSTLRMLSTGGHPTVALYRNDGGRFADVTSASGFSGRGWGTGVCIADYDNDGFEDVYVTAFGRNILWRNLDGRMFTPTAAAGDPRWSTGCAFGDYDRDGDVDLYVANYVQLNPATVPRRGSAASCRFETIDVPCGPLGLRGEPDTLYRNEGDMTFVDVTADAGVVSPGYPGFGVVFSDLDDDGWLDIYVANDSAPNLFFHNRGDGTFSERALEVGLALSADAREQAGMGVDVGDADGDGRLDVLTTNFSQDYTTLYRNQGNGFFVDDSLRSGLGGYRPYLGWGIGFVDVDNDAWLDVFVANGHIYPDVGLTGIGTYLQRNQLFRNVGRGRFRDVTTEVGGPLLVEQSSRGTAFGDYDNDGDLDILVSVIDGRPLLLRNDSTGGHWITLRLQGTQSNRSAIGAKVTIRVGARRQVSEVRSGGSYVSHSDTRVHFGLGTASIVEQATIRWPSGTIEELGSLDVDRFYVAREGEGVQPGR